MSICNVGVVQCFAQIESKDLELSDIVSFILSLQPPTDRGVAAGKAKQAIAWRVKLTGGPQELLIRLVHSMTCLC